MKTFVSVLIATAVAACVAAVIALIPVLFEPVFLLWVIAMMIILTATDYTRNRHHHKPY